jgi:hypothetical protein
LIIFRPAKSGSSWTAQGAVLSAAEYASITSFSFAGGATLNGDPHRRYHVHRGGPAGGFEINRNLNDLLGTLITTKGVVWTADNLVINGSQADTFKVLWDYLDDAMSRQ